MIFLHETSLGFKMVTGTFKLFPIITVSCLFPVYGKSPLNCCATFSALLRKSASDVLDQSEGSNRLKKLSDSSVNLAIDCKWYLLVLHSNGHYHTLLHTFYYQYEMKLQHDIAA